MRRLLPLFMLFTLFAAGQQTVRMRGISLADMPASDSVAADGGTVWDFTAVRQRGDILGNISFTIRQSSGSRAIRSVVAL